MPVVTAAFCEYAQKPALLRGPRTRFHQIEINPESLPPDIETDSAIAREKSGRGSVVAP
jgi:hypothetical protein